MRRRGTIVAVVALSLSTCVMVPAVVIGSFGTASLTSPAVASQTASRGTQVQLTPPTPPRCRRVAVVGDSLTAASASELRRELASAGFEHIVDGQVSRRIPSFVRDPYSGVSAARRIRSSWGEADCWVIGLGSNDLESGADDPELAGRWIDEQLAALTPGANVWWINVAYRLERGNDFDFPAATATFNAVLHARASGDRLIEVIDWYSMMDAHPEWFVDGVHVRAPAYTARTQLVLAALS